MKRTICFSRSVKGLVATLASSKDSFAIGEPFIPPLSKARWRLRIWNGLQLTVCDRVRLLTVLLTTRQGVDYGRKESRQMCPSRVQMPGAQGQQVLWSLLPGFGGPPISRLQLRTPGLCWWEIPESVAWPDFVTWIVTQLVEKDGLGVLATQVARWMKKSVRFDEKCLLTEACVTFWQQRSFNVAGRFDNSGPGGRWFESTRPDQFVSIIYKRIRSEP